MSIIKNNKSFLFTCTLALLCFAGVGALYAESVNIKPTTKTHEKLKIVTTTAHIADLVQNIAGNNMHVEYLMGPGTDPHLYRPVRSDIVKLTNADMIFYNGMHLEGQMVELFENLKTEKPVYSLAENIEKPLHDNNNIVDPHIWMDVENWISATDLVARAVSEIKPEFKEDFNTAATSYKDKLAALDRYIHAATQTIPKENKVLVTAHDAFGYYGHAYDLEVIGIQGLSTASEAGLYKIEKLVNRISQQKIPAIFTETSVSDQNIRAIRDGVKANGHSVVIGASLYSDSLGAPDTLTGTYIGMMEHNTNVITKALGGTLPLKLQTKNKTAFAIPNE